MNINKFKENLYSVRVKLYLLASLGCLLPVIFILVWNYVAFEVSLNGPIATKLHIHNKIINKIASNHVLLDEPYIILYQLLEDKQQLEYQNNTDKFNNYFFKYSKLFESIKQLNSLTDDELQIVKRLKENADEFQKLGYLIIHRLYLNKKYQEAHLELEKFIPLRDKQSVIRNVLLDHLHERYGEINESISLYSEKTLKISLLLSIVISLIIAFFGFFIISQIVERFYKILAIINQLNLGNYDIHVPFQKKQDETGKLSRAIEDWRQLMISDYQERQELFLTQANLNSKQKELENTLNTLQEKEKFINSLLEVIPNGIIIVDNKLSICRVNKYVEELLSYSASELLNQDIVNLTCSTNKEQCQRLFTEFVNNKSEKNTPYYTNSKINDKNGREIECSLGITTIQRESDVFIVLSVHDLTEEKAKDKLIRDNEERLNLALSSANIGMWDRLCFSPHTQHINDVWANMLGYTVNELDEIYRGDRYLTWKNLVHPEDFIVASNCDHCHENNLLLESRSEFRMRHKSGKYRWIRSIGRVVERDKFGNAQRIVGIHIDITEQKESEQKLKENEQKAIDNQKILDYALNSAKLGLWDANILENITSRNDYWYAMLGFTQEELLAQSNDEGIKQRKNLIHPEDQERVLDLLEQHNQNKIAEIRCEYRMRKKSGEFIWVSSIGQAVKRDENSRATRVIGFDRDITEERLAENKLKIALKNAKSATQAKSNFLANMSHEIRTPMNAILGIAQILLQSNITSSQKNYLEKLLLSGAHLLELLNDILDLSKIESGKIVLEKITFKLDEVINQVVHQVIEKVRNKGLELILDPAPNLALTYLGDPLRLRQILINFVSNAVKFTSQGQIVIRIKCLLQEKGKSQLYFSVEDSGIGMTEEQKELMFQNFQQADSSITRKYGGTGLGLAISKRLAELMNGDVWVESVVNSGSTFWFTAWLDDDELNRENNNRQFSSKLSDKYALVVEENDTLRNMLIEQLKHIGLLTIGFPSIGEAIIHFNENPFLKFSVVFFDCIDNNQVTINILEKFQSMPANAEAKFVRLSYLDNCEVKENSLKFEKIVIDDFLQKPISPSDIFDVVAKIFQLTITKRLLISKEIDEAKCEIPRGAKILLVEDNEINQEIGLAMLNNLSLDVDIAENGVIAVEKVLNKQYDLILMDMQMPIMDGLEATKQIRQYDHLAFLPIIAMTANAMVDDKQHCIAAGMNDYLSKPIQHKILIRKLAQWLRPVSESIFSQFTDELQILPEAASSAELIDDLILDKLGALSRMGGNNQLYLQLLQRFCTEYSNFSSSMQQQFLSDDYESTKRYVHSLKGSAANLGATVVAKVSEEFEHKFANIINRIANNNESQSKSIVIKELREYINIIEQALLSLQEQVKILVDQNQADQEQITISQTETTLSKSSNKDIALMLEHLKVKLEQFDADAQDMFAQNKVVLQKIFQDKFIFLNDAINQFDFEQALEIIIKHKVNLN